MRVLFVSLAEKSHLYCQTPLAWALTAAGHEVRVASTPPLTETTTRAGLTAVPVGRDSGIHEGMAAHRETQDIPTANWSQTEHGDISWEELSRRYRISVNYGISAYNDPMIDGLVEFARDWRPDLVIRDPLAYAGGIAARACGAAHARLLWCADVWGRSRRTYLDMLPHAPEDERTDPMAEWLADRCAPFGVEHDEELVNGQFTLDTMPHSLRLPTHLNVLDMRYIPYNGRAVVTDWLREKPARPRVCLTLGASNTEDYGGDYVSVPDILTALGDLDVEVVATLAGAGADLLSALPDNARVVEGVALNTLLPSCSAIIHHGGFGSYATALSYGVPQLILSTSVSDHELRGTGLRNAGAGEFAHWSKADASFVRDAVRRLVEEPSYGEAARALQEEGARLASPQRLVPELEEAVEAHRRRRSSAIV
ncbi:activator-dependent family glycosyltransferase [Streptomyces armeniacus]|uniref:Activator-dependent family glycosyltransferase n=1 Tax=Streptomyces armeniacus TaxID=83291 RepID=A0A345XY53_9ACTN|nr:activator-dependent family glycosyltransferase [Streptomyces armeniacus]AXK36569.1 activator-dependent family glycosyltransferase [Streptomyces armeniacus]QIQ28618.1 Nbc22 [Streptomyces sp.]